MRAIVAECVIEAAEERSEPAPELGGEAPRRSSAQTEADKVRVQQQLRRKVKLARRAMAAHRSR
jgi:hypothetical protein